MLIRRSCFQSVKDIKFESNSQLSIMMVMQVYRCFQSVKDIKFESNSQLKAMKRLLSVAVSSLGKIIKFGAIHN